MNPDSPLHQALRAATRSAHARINHHPLMSSLVHGRLDAGDYAAALSALYALHAPLEETFTAFLPDPDFAPRRRSVDLAEDLALLGCDVSDIDPVWAGNGPDDIAAYVGMRYVIEGSALGGAVIARQLEHRLPQALADATSFFSSQSVTGEWPRFWSLAARLAPMDTDMACRRAIGLFAEIEELWNRHRPPQRDRSGPGNR